MTVEKAGSEREGIGAQLRCGLCSRSIVHILFTLQKPEAEEGSSQLGDLAGKLPLSLSIFLLKLVDFSNLLSLLRQITNRGDNVLEGNKHPNIFVSLL